VIYTNSDGADDALLYAPSSDLVPADPSYDNPPLQLEGESCCNYMMRHWAWSTAHPLPDSPDIIHGSGDCDELCWGPDMSEVLDPMGLPYWDCASCHRAERLMPPASTEPCTRDQWRGVY
jgi:hypothetical protein